MPAKGPPAPFFPIPADKLPGMVGRVIHLAWARPGARWRLERVEGDTLRLLAVKSGRRLTAKAADACYVRSDEPQGGPP